MPRVAASGLLVGLVIVAVLGLAVGPVVIAPSAIADVLAGGGDPTVRTILFDLRAPRVVLAILVGASLGISGTVLQGALRNALAEPYLLGVSGGAAVGAVAVVAAGAPAGSMVSLGAFAGGIAAVILVMGVARAGGAPADPRTLLMAGVVVGAFANAAIMIVLASSPAETTRGALWWMMGSLGSAQWRDAQRLAAVMLVTVPWLVHWARDLDALALGPDAAAALGVAPEATGRRLYVVSSILAAGTVAAAGLVGFVGLLVPHMARRIAGAGHRGALVAAGLAGGTLVVLADVAARLARAPAELPLGAVTAAIGVPFFLVLLRGSR